MAESISSSVAAEPVAAADEGAPSAAAATAAAESSTSTRRQKASDGRFQRDLRSMMYGFGDDRQPLVGSVQLLEELVVDYVASILGQAQHAAEHRQRGTRSSGIAKVKDQDLLFVLRKDRRRQERVKELLQVADEVKKGIASIDGRDRVQDE